MKLSIVYRLVWMLTITLFNLADPGQSETDSLCLSDRDTDPGRWET